MPCRDDRDDYFTESRVRDELEPLLCEACTLLDDLHGLSTKGSAQLKAWYKQHTAHEEDRVRYEAALKLNERDRRLLGINLAQLKAAAEKRCK